MQFRPSITQTLILVTLAAVFLRLGLWQLDRRAEKAALFERFATAPSMGLPEALAEGEPFTQVSARGRYDPERHLLLDNKVWQGRAGVHVLTPFRMNPGVTVLVNRGWLPLPPDRSSLPDVTTPDNEVDLTGRVAPPPAVGIQLGVADKLVPSEWPQLITYFDLTSAAGALGESLPPWVVLLDAGDPNGFGDRQWLPAAMTPEVHGGYAVQWLALLLATIVAWVIVGFRRGEQMDEGPQATGNGERAGGKRE